MSLKIPSKILVILTANTTYASGGLIMNGKALRADNKSLKKFTNAYDKVKPKNAFIVSYYLQPNSQITDTIDDLEFDNEPMSGFKVVKSGFDGDFCTILHPMGFEMTISTINLMDIINSCTLVNGEIKDELFFSENMQLVNPNTDAYKFLVKKANAHEKLKEKAKDVEVGDVLYVKDTDTRYVYCGKYAVYRAYNNFYLRNRERSVLMHILKNLSTSKYICTDKLITNSYVNSSQKKHAVDRNIVISECNIQIDQCCESFYDKSFNHTYSYPLLVGNKNFNYEDLEVEYRNVDFKHFKIPSSLRDAYSIGMSGYPVLVEKDGINYYVISIGYRRYGFRGENCSFNKIWDLNYSENYDVLGYEVTLDDSNKVVFGVDVSQHQSYNSAFSTPYDTRSNKPKLQKVGDFLTGTFKIGKYKLKEHK